MSTSGETSHATPDRFSSDRHEPGWELISGWVLVYIGALMVARAESLSSTRTGLTLTQLLGVIFWGLGLRSQLSLAVKAWTRRYGQAPNLGKILEEIRQLPDNNQASRAIRYQIREDPRTPATPNISVRVTNNAVKLQGKVPAQDAKDAADEIARSFAERIERSREVYNLIKVEPALAEA